ncbi:hypothetical protein EIP91_006498 [Steccherinum ochraceum]|uniref:Nucleolar complex-associated protein 3 n=1 Tax=Steccherinum ochraceum TaxID=92696 RepID=A0A4R0RMB7_9APHY|nr:hypothetical protein EIP91_006498 [Steccherinum ochraceum]
MVGKPQKKRRAQDVAGPSKKRKLSAPKGEQKKKKKSANVKGKDKAMDRGFIPIPVGNEDESDLSDQDMEVLEEFGQAAGFLTRLDEKGITRSKKETVRLHQMNKPDRKPVEDDDLPSIDSGADDDDDDGASWDSNIDDDDILASDSEPEDDISSVASGSRERRKGKAKGASDDEEMPYEVAPRKRKVAWQLDEEKDKGISRLPIKLADGSVQTSSAKVFLPQEEKAESESEFESDEEDTRPSRPVVEDVSTGARFGRPAVVDVIGNKSRKVRLQLAKEQLAGICQEIISDPENSLGLLRRLHTFSLPEITTPTHPDPVPNDPVVRKLTILSQLAVFKDIIPGYRIRPLSEKEQAEKVSQIVQRTRDWEQGLVNVYQTYLKGLDVELKAKSELAEVALQCMCTLLTEVTHFNFRVNLMSSIVASLSRRSWDKSSDLCLNTVIQVFRADVTGEPSLELVRLLNRMIKERKFRVHPEVLSCLSYLRLRNELGRKEVHDWPGRSTSSERQKDRSDQPHLSKKARKVMKERQEIQKEMREAEAEVDKEERAAAHTEALKLLFVLYFRILKNPEPTPLLPAALHGISKFAHLVNIDFFKDLMKVLKDLMLRESIKTDDSDTGPLSDAKIVQHQLLCVTTAFELLTGQGEALEIDLTDFINRLYALIPVLSQTPALEDAPPRAFKADATLPVSSVHKTTTTATLLFRALDLAFSPRTPGVAGAPPPWRSAAFAKRLLTASLHWPSVTVLRALAFVKGLVERDSKLEALLSTDDRTGNGAYRADLDDPQLCNPFATSFWEVHLLSRTHLDADVREAARALLTASSSSS